MRAVEVAAPDGSRWTVRVAWAPRWRGFVRRFGGWRRNRRPVDPDALPDDRQIEGAFHVGGVALEVGGVVLAVALVLIGVIVAVALFWWVLLPALLVVLDLAVVLVLLLIGVAGRVLLRRPWTVEATTDDGRRRTAEVVGWRAALRTRDDWAAELTRSGS